MSGPQELEKTATTYASCAVEFENQGEIVKAISHYQKAIECLNQLIQRYPEHRFSKIYNEWSAAYQERITVLKAASAKSNSKKPPVESQEHSEKASTKKEVSIDLAPVLLEINRKLDNITASITQLQNDVINLKVNVNDAAGKTDLAQKEVAEIRNLVYSIKYDR
jgi:tetratricopeptide (TPR) repeat protein